MMCLSFFAFFTILSYTTASWNYHGHYNGRFQRGDHWPGCDDDVNNEGNDENHDFPHHPHGFGHHHNYPRHFDQHPHMHFDPHSVHNFGHPHPHNIFGHHHFGNFNNKDSSSEDQSNNFGPSMTDFNGVNNQPWQNQQRGAHWNGQRWVFPEDDVFTSPRPTTTTKRPAVTNSPWTSSTTKRSAVTNSRWTTTTSSVSPLTILTCMRSCPVTSEYNPVCGSNNVTYNNPGRLECAKNCGVDVRMSLASACPRPTPPPETSSNANLISTTTPTPSSSTNTPINNVVTTRFTTIDINGNSAFVTPATNVPVVTISSDVLDSIFTKPTTPNDEDIDIRHED